MGAGSSRGKGSLMLTPSLLTLRKTDLGIIRFALLAEGNGAGVSGQRRVSGGNNSRNQSTIKIRASAIASVWLVLGAILLVLSLRPAVAGVCDPLLVVFGGAGDDPNAEMMFKTVARQNNLPDLLWDDLMHPLMRDVVNRMGSVYERNKIKIVYFQHRVGQLGPVLNMAKNHVEKYRQRCQFTPIGFVGFSWGGDAVYKLAHKVDAKIQALVTLDPVSVLSKKRGVLPIICGTQTFPTSLLCSIIFESVFELPKPKNVKTWLHVWTRGDWDPSDVLAILGGSWLEQEHADTSIQMAKTPHRGTCAMYKQVEMLLLSELIDNGDSSCASRPESVSCSLSNAWSCR